MSEYPKIMYEKNINGQPESVSVIGYDLAGDGWSISTYLVQSGIRYNPSFLFNTKRELLDSSIAEFIYSIKLNESDIQWHRDIIETLRKQLLELEEMRNKL